MKKRMFGQLLVTLAALLWGCPAWSQVIDLQTDRMPVVSIAKDWRFHAGDDARWSQPGVDDSGWKLIQPSTNWVPQGYSEQQGLAWFRFRLRVPPKTPSVVLLMPRVDKSYQLFAGGQLVGQVGSLPPAAPSTLTSAARVFTLPVHTGEQAQVVTVALRLWQAPSLVNLRPSVLRGRALAGDPDAVLRQFALGKASVLLSDGNAYTQAVVAAIVAAATLLLFWLTREGFYLWFALNLLLSTASLPILLASQHYGWNFLGALDAYILEELLGGISFVLFLRGAVSLRRQPEIGLAILFNVLADLGPFLLVTYQLSAKWADGMYFVFATASEAALVWYMVRGWRAGIVYARLLLVPYLIGNVVAEVGNLGHFLVDLHVPHAEQLIGSDIQLLETPFSVSLSDVGNMIAVLGLLGVLVYRFARTSRERQRLASALQAAHDIQHRLVPVDIPMLGGLHTEIVYLAAEEVGGDFCQVLPRADGSILVAIGDVSGKGLQAAMLGTLAVGALRSMADEQMEPFAVLGRLNDVILRTENAGFITCLCLELSPGGDVRLSNAGHLAPYLNGVELEVAPGLPLGIVADVVYEQSRFLLPATARLTLLSDGVVEARSRTGELFGFERTTEISQLPASQIARMAHGHGQEDDITIITLDWRAPALAAAL